VNAGARVTIVDDLSNSYLEVLVRMERVLGDKFSRVKFQQVRAARARVRHSSACSATAARCPAPPQVSLDDRQAIAAVLKSESCALAPQHIRRQSGQTR